MGKVFLSHRIFGGLDPANDADDTYGIGDQIDFAYTTKAALLSNDAEIVSYNESLGKYEYNLDTPKTETAINWIKSLYENGGLKLFNGETANPNVRQNVQDFIDGKCLFLIENTTHGISDRYSLAYNTAFEFSWVPFPKGPDAENYNYGGSISIYDRFFAIPLTGVDHEMVGIVAPELFKPFNGMDEDDWREYFSIGMFFNEESEKWFYHMYDNLTNNYDYIFTFFTDIEFLNKILTGEKSLTQVIEEYEYIGNEDINLKLNGGK